MYGRTSRRLSQRAILAFAFAAGIVFLALAPSGEAAFPGTNGKIAFRSDRDGNYEIYSMNADGTGQTRLTNNTAFDAVPVWSPDGTQDRLPQRPRRQLRDLRR